MLSAGSFSFPLPHLSFVFCRYPASFTTWLPVICPVCPLAFNRFNHAVPRARISEQICVFLRRHYRFPSPFCSSFRSSQCGQLYAKSVINSSFCMHLLATTTPSIVLSVRRILQFAQQLSMFIAFSSKTAHKKRGSKGTFVWFPLDPSPWPQLYHAILNLSIEKFSISVFLSLNVSTQARECPVRRWIRKTGCLSHSCLLHTRRANHCYKALSIHRRLTDDRRPEQDV